MAWLYSNENFPLPVVEHLRLLGHDVLTTQDAGMADQAISDLAVLNFAISDNRAILTLNRRHFIRLHTENPNHTGVMVCTFDKYFKSQAMRIHAALTKQESLNGQLIRINRPSN